MESDKFRFKHVKNDSNDKSVRCFKVNFYTVKKSDLKSISDRLKKIEDTLDNLITGSSFCFEEGKDSNRNKSEYHDKAIVNLNQSKILKYEDYPKQLMRFYFVYQYYYTSLPMFSIDEYNECMNRFHNKPPAYLVYSILSKSSLNSPCSQLYTKNLDYCDYYYELSVKHLNTSMNNREIDIYILHTLLILMWIDENLNRQYISMSRVLTCVKLVQTMGLDIGDLNLNAKKVNLSKFNLIKLLSIIDYNDNEASKIFNLPKTNIFKKLDHGNYIKRMEEKNNKFLDQSSSLIPKEYYLTYEANEFYLNLHLTHINPLERDLNNKSVASNYDECFQLIQHITHKYHNLPFNIKYSKDCLCSEKILKSPLLLKVLFLYERVLKQTSTVFELLVGIIHESTTNQLVFLTKNILNFNEKVLNLLKDQQFSILKSSKNTVKLRASIFFYFGRLLLDLIEKLNQEANIRKSSRLTRCIEAAVAEFNSFSVYFSNLQSGWDGSEKILRLLIERYEAIKLIV